MLALRKLLEQHKYKIVHIHQNSASMVMDAVVAKSCGVPIIIGHSHNTRCNIMWQHRLFKPFVNKVLTHRFACSEAAGYWIFGHRNDVQVIHNAIDGSHYKFREDVRNCVRKELKLDTSFVVGFVGRLHAQKNPSRILSIFATVCKKKRNSILLIIGDGEEKLNMINSCKQLGIFDKVMFLGKQDNINELMMAMDVFLMPSLYEGLPVVIVESQATGLPCFISENVPAPNLIHTLKTIGLKEDNETWADALLNPPYFNRVDAQQMIINGGYDISNEALALQKFYLSHF